MALEQYTIHRSVSTRTSGGHTYYWSRWTGDTSVGIYTSEHACVKSAKADAQYHEVDLMIVQAWRAD